MTSKRALLAAAVLCVAGYIFIYATGRASHPIRSDGYSYYVYLPAWIIYGDASLSAVARDCCGGEFPAFTAIIRWPGSRRWVNAHPIGVAVLQAPFFLAAHGLTKWSNLTADGFTPYYQHAVGISGIFWTIAGLFVVRRLLLVWFGDRVVTATLVALLFGTGLYHYATYDASYSHAYSFFLRRRPAAIDRAVVAGRSARNGARPRLARRPARRDGGPDRPHASSERAVPAALPALRRHERRNRQSRSGRARRPPPGAGDRHARRRARGPAAAADLSRRHRPLSRQLVRRPRLQLLVAASLGSAVQRAEGRCSSGRRCCSWRSLATSCGIARPAVSPSARPLVMAANVYIIASWWDWQFGASYGHRGFVDALPIFAVGLAAFFEWSAARPARALVVGVVSAMAIALSIFQMLQYWNGVMPMADLTWDQYRAVFLRWR